MRFSLRASDSNFDFRPNLLKYIDIAGAAAEEVHSLDAVGASCSGTTHDNRIEPILIDFFAGVGARQYFRCGICHGFSKRYQNVSRNLIRVS